MTKQRWMIVSASLFALCACAVGPDYKQPAVATPAAFKEADGFWRPAQPAPPATSVPAAWNALQDPVLADLMQKARADNQTLKQAEATYRAATATADETRASFFPSLSLTGSDTRAGTGRRQAATTYKAGTAASWEPDLWGRIRRNLESAEASAEASAADLAWAQWSLEAELATAYIHLRAADELVALRETSATAYARTLQIVRDRLAVGIATQADVSSAQTLAATSETNLEKALIARAQYEHEIAVLTGQPPAALALAPASLAKETPSVPATIPSLVLLRRPDIRAAERAVAAANAQIGVEVAAYFPDITLSASGGYAAAALSKLMQASSGVWSVGPSLALTIFDGGAREAKIAAARASYDASVAVYRQTVLTAFQDIEDELASLSHLAKEAETAHAALQSATEAETLSLNQYKEGLVDYTSVTIAMAARVTAAEQDLTVRQSRLLATIALSRALGSEVER